MTEIISALNRHNRHRKGYDFELLIRSVPALEAHVTTRADGVLTVDFSNDRVVQLVNKALLFAHYGLLYWKLPEGYLCPGVPGRADYLLYLGQLSDKAIPRGSSINLLDIGTGASCIYPLLAQKMFGWSVVASDIDETTLQFATKNVKENILTERIEIRKQENLSLYFKGIIKKGELFDFTICNPPFFKSEKEAQSANKRKNKNLKNSNLNSLNFKGRPHELWVNGGELKFVGSMITESKEFKKQVFWFSSLVSNKDNLQSLIKICNKNQVLEYKVIEMQHGKKRIHALAWTFLDPKLRLLWSEARWS